VLLEDGSVVRSVDPLMQAAASAKAAHCHSEGPFIFVLSRTANAHRASSVADLAGRSVTPFYTYLREAQPPLHADLAYRVEYPSVSPARLVTSLLPAGDCRHRRPPYDRQVGESVSPVPVPALYAGGVKASPFKPERRSLCATLTLAPLCSLQP
jgi:hypothetical protein